MDILKIIKKPDASMLRRMCLRMMCLAFAGFSGIALADVAQAPLFVTERVKPNIMYTIDDSGSMVCDVLPELPGKPAGWTCRDIALNGANLFSKTDGSVLQVRQYRSSAVNRIFYDPTVRYRPWRKADGTWYPDARPSAAYKDPRDTSGWNKTINLVDPDDDNPYYAFYYTYNGNGVTTSSNFTKVKIESGKTYTKHVGRTDCIGTNCTFAEESTNFANWYTYYRKRLYTAIAGTSQAFYELNDGFRVGYGRINSSGQTVDGQTTGTVRMGVRDFTGADKTNWFNLLINTPASGGTPLRRAIDDVGKYFSRTDNAGPWGKTPGSNVTETHLACRKNYHILMTDGYWNSDNAATADARTADDNAPHPYGSSYSSTLADVAYYYWKTDLRTDLDNTVPTSSSDPASYQHVVQHAVGLGVDGSLPYPGPYAGASSLPSSWPDPQTGNTDGTVEIPERVDDLWHAAVNGHGMFFSAKNPQEFLDALKEILSDIVRQTAAAGVAVSSTRAEDGGLAYVPGFESGTWTGKLKAYRINADGTLATAQLWDAADALPTWDSRNIVTWNGVKGVNFAWPATVGPDTIRADQKAALGSSDVLEYIKGNGNKEKTDAAPTNPYRRRTAKLGDIVNSAPLIVSAVDRGYSAIPSVDDNNANEAGETYAAFLGNKLARRNMIYVGANDGMLHAFDAGTAIVDANGNVTGHNTGTGAEKFAFIPGAVYPNLSSLSSLSYSHKYFVDGHITEGDAHFARTGETAPSWKNVLMGSTAAGGKSVFAIDITDPETLTAGSVMWEKTADSEDVDNQDMGYVMGQVELERMANGSWAVIHGNGYDSGNKKAVLYIRDVRDGSIIRKIDTKIGSDAAPNGLSAPVFVRDSQRRVIAAYAGDLQGNLWKFDLSSSNLAEWKVAYGTSTTPAPLYAAKDSANNPQPIAQRPSISVHPKGGYILTFGTGKYFEDADKTSTSLQSIYGIRDNGSPVETGALQQQTMTAYSVDEVVEGVHIKFDGATITNNNVNWDTAHGWFINLNLWTGERVIADTTVMGDILWLATFAPDNADLCRKGGRSRIIGINHLTGGAIKSIFDANGDGRINSYEANLSALNVPGSVSEPSLVRVGSNRGVVNLNPLDGPVIQQKVNTSPQPFRTWHILAESY